jgi:tetratricopeptide (TPR) repeat protein
MQKQHNGRKAKFLLAVTVAALTTLSSMLIAQADTNQSTLVELEQHFFFRTYPDKSVSDRLSHLEKEAFGQAMTGTDSERLARLTALPIAHDAPATSSQPTSVSSKPSSNAAVNPVNQASGSLDESTISAIEEAHSQLANAKQQEVNAILAAGVNLWRAGRGQEAREKFEECQKLDSHNAEAYYSLGIIDESYGALSEALSSYQRAQQINPDNTEYSDAVAQVQKKISAWSNLDSRRVQLRTISAAALNAFTHSDYDRALDLYLALDEKAPNQALIKYNIGTIYLLQKHEEEALKYFQKAKELAPLEDRYVLAYQRLKEKLSKQQIGMQIN